MAQPPFVKTNVPGVGAGRETLYFLADRLLVYDAAGVGAVTYRTLEISASSRRFVESNGVPSGCDGGRPHLALCEQERRSRPPPCYCVPLRNSALSFAH
jgi:hypothetical protein